MTEQQGFSRGITPTGSSGQSGKVDKPPPSILRQFRKSISPELITLTGSRNSTVFREYIGNWRIPSSNPGTSCQTTPEFQVTAFGKPVPNRKVTLQKGSDVVGTAKTDKNGKVNFPLSFDEAGVETYYAYVGQKPPVLLSPNPRVESFSVSVWYIAIHSKNISDRWARWQGRAYFKPLPRNFWRDQPRSVIGLAGGNIGFADLVPVVSEVGYPLEVGVSAFCNTKDPYPNHDECCEARKDTWWQFDVHATNDPKQVASVRKGESGHVGGGKINIDYHLKYNIAYSGVTFEGRCLKKVNCDWEEGTAPRCD